MIQQKTSGRLRLSTAAALALALLASSPVVPSPAAAITQRPGRGAPRVKPPEPVRGAPSAGCRI
jgi:hypothetical protein